MSFVSEITDLGSIWKKNFFSQFICNILWSFVAIILILPIAFSIPILTSGPNAGNLVFKSEFWTVLFIGASVILFVVSLIMGSTFLIAQKFTDKGESLFDPAMLGGLKLGILPFIINSLIYGFLIITPIMLLEQYKFNNALDETTSLLINIVLSIYFVIILPVFLLASVDAVLGTKSITSIVEGVKVYGRNIVDALVMGAIFYVALFILEHGWYTWSEQFSSLGGGVEFYGSLLVMIFLTFTWLLLVLPAIFYIPWLINKKAKT